MIIMIEFVFKISVVVITVTSAYSIMRYLYSNFTANRFSGFPPFKMLQKKKNTYAPM